MTATPARLARLVAVAAAVVLAAGPAPAADPPLPKRSHTFKTVGDLKIEADVYRADDTTVRPVVVWIHGGALITGNRKSVPRDLLDLCRDEGYALVSIDYRLAPEVKLPEIVADVEDAFRWLRGAGAKECRLDPDRVVVTGGSAGGYLTLMTGVVVRPRPTALVAYWGYGDVDGDWYTKASEFYRKQVPLIDRADALKGVGGKVVTGSEDGIDFPARGRFYHYLRQNGLWTKEVTGFDPATEKPRLDRYCPVRNVSPDYPPTLLVHGTEDTDVPYQLSADMAKELARFKVPHELVTVTGAGHGLAGGDKKLVADARGKALAFIRTHLNRGKPTRPDPATPQAGRAAVERGLGFLLKDAAKWRTDRECSTCHHGTMTVWALCEAKGRGYEVAADALPDEAKWTKSRLLERIDLPRDTRPGWSMVSTPALYLSAMALAVPGQDAVSADELRRIAGHLLRHQEADGSWSSAPPKNRPPPVFKSDEVATLLAYLALGPRVPADPKEKSEDRDPRDRPVTPDRGSAGRSRSCSSSRRAARRSTRRSTRSPTPRPRFAARTARPRPASPACGSASTCPGSRPAPTCSRWCGRCTTPPAASSATSTAVARTCCTPGPRNSPPATRTPASPTRGRGGSSGRRLARSWPTPCPRPTAPPSRRWSSCPGRTT